MISVIAALLINAGAPEQSSGFLMMQGTWYEIAADGSTSATFKTIGGKHPTSLHRLPDGRLLLTAERAGKQDGLFSFDGETLTDISISDGFHTDVSSRAGSIVVAHHPDENSGPPGGHGQMANAQIWTTQSGQAKRLTDSTGCKSHPQSTSTGFVFVHNSCRGESGLAILEGGKKPHSLIPISGNRVISFSISPNEKHICITRGHHKAFQVVVYDWPAIKNETILSEVAEGSEPPGCVWTSDSRIATSFNQNALVRFQVSATERKNSHPPKAAPR